jgi:hypothetical protein
MAGAEQCYGIDEFGKPALTQSAVAFADYGAKSTDPKKGDLVVFQDTDDAKKGHVGFVEDIIYDKKGNIVDLVVFGGNQKNQFCAMKASDMGWEMREVIAYRTVPDVSGHQLGQAMKKADKIMEEAQAEKTTVTMTASTQKPAVGKQLTR